MAYPSHEAYFEQVPEAARSRLAAIQSQVESLIPDAVRCISYNMPAFRGEKVFFYFAAFKKHIGIYPPVCKDKRLIAELERYRNEKGNLSFPLSEPLPLELIGRVAMALYQERQSA